MYICIVLEDITIRIITHSEDLPEMTCRSFFHSRDLFEILEKRSEINLSTIICSQREPASWSSMILNDEVSANAILKRATRHYTVVIKPASTD